MELATAIAERAALAGLELPRHRVRALADHARAVLEANQFLHLTSITDEREFVERHLGESFEGARLLVPDVSGTLVDLGSGNGYPGLPVAAARPGLEPVLVESSAKKAFFLRSVLSASGFPGGEVLEGQVQRAADLEGVAPVRVLTTRAMGAWEKIVPRLASALHEDARILLWAGAEAQTVLKRKVWQRFTLERRHPLPGRDRSWVWLLRC